MGVCDQVKAPLAFPSINEPTVPVEQKTVCRLTDSLDDLEGSVRPEKRVISIYESAYCFRPVMCVLQMKSEYVGC